MCRSSVITAIDLDTRNCAGRVPCIIAPGRSTVMQRHASAMRELIGELKPF